MARQGGLGKGLVSLIPADVLASAGGAADGPRLEELPITAIRPNPHQPRQHFDEETLTELAASITELGVLQPVLVRASGDGTYELIAGERRWRAARRANLAVIPAVIRRTDDIGSVEQALVENLHRQDLTVLEEAAAYQQLIEDFHLTHEQVAARVGKSRSGITNTLRILTLPPGVLHLLADGRLSAGHAKALLGTPDRTRQEALARQVAAEGWSVRALEDALRGPTTVESTPATGSPALDGAGVSRATRLRPPGLLELESLLADHLSTRVHVSMGRKNGRLTIDFADLEDLERIYYRMVATESGEEPHVE